jgi:hypothetical protein
MTVWIYDVTNATAIQPVNYQIQLGTTGTSILQYCQFQTAVPTAGTAGMDYRLCFHIGTASTGAYVIDYNQFQVWIPYTATVGSIITEWQSYTPTLQGFGTPSTMSVYWRRVGGTVEIQGSFTAGTTTAVEARMSLPPGLVIDSTIVPVRTIVCARQSRGVAWDVTGVYEFLMRGGDSYLNFGVSYANPAAATFPVDTTPLNGNIFISGLIKTFSIVGIPIAGWGSNVFLTSTVGDGRVVACLYNSGTSGATTTPSITIKYTNRIFDTHSAYNTSTGQYTCPVSGIYRVNFWAYNVDTGGSVVIGIYKTPAGSSTATLYVSCGSVEPNNIAGGGSAMVQANSGDRIDLRGNSTANLYGYYQFGVQLIQSGAQAITNGETIACRYTVSGQTATSSVRINFSTRTYDSYNSVTTGASWVFTAPSSGIYSVSSILGSNVSSSSIISHLYKNASTLICFSSGGSGAWGATAVISDVVSLIQGETLYIMCTVASPSTACSGHIAIARIGNYAP